MRYEKHESYVDVIGRIWMPAATCAMRYPMSDHDVANARNDAGELTRESVEQWLSTHSGDFQSIEDFRISISLADGTDFDSDWEHGDDSACTYSDCMYQED